MKAALGGIAAFALLVACDAAAGSPAPDVPAVLCVPSCDGRECGSDGCGGVCGLCGAGET